MRKKYTPIGSLRTRRRKLLKTAFMGIAAAGIAASALNCSENRGKPASQQISIYKDINESRKTCARADYSEMYLEYYGIGFGSKRIIPYECIESVDFIGNPDPETAIRVSFLEGCEMPKIVSSCIIARNVKREGYRYKEIFPEPRELEKGIRERIGSPSEQRKKLESKGENKNRIKWLGIFALVLTAYFLLKKLFGLRKRTIKYRVKRAVREKLSRFYRKIDYLEESKKIGRTKVIFTNEVSRSSYDKGKGVLRLNREGIKAHYKCESKEELVFYCVLRAAYEINRAYAGCREYKGYDLGFLDRSIALVYAYEIAKSLVDYDEKSIYYEEKYGDPVGVFAELIDSVLLTKTYFKKDFSVVIDHLEEKGVSDEEVDKLLELIDAASKQTHKSIELFGYIEYLKRKYNGGKDSDNAGGIMGEKTDFEKEVEYYKGRLKALTERVEKAESREECYRILKESNKLLAPLLEGKEKLRDAIDEELDRFDRLLQYKLEDFGEPRRRI